MLPNIKKYFLWNSLKYEPNGYKVLNNEKAGIKMNPKQFLTTDLLPFNKNQPKIEIIKVIK